MIYFFMILFFVLMDLFRDKGLSGWAKAGWVVFLLILPILAVLVYLIVRGRGMQERRAQEAAEAKEQFDAYVRQQAAASGGGSAADEIARAKALLDAGTITEAEYEQLKAKALAG